MSNHAAGIDVCSRAIGAGVQALDEEDAVSQRRRFFMVLAVGAVCNALLVTVVWALGVRGPLGVAVPLALTTPLMHLLDSRLAQQARLPVGPAVAHGLLGGATAWITLNWLGVGS